MEYIYREITKAVERGAKYYPVVVVTGPRQSGKSTLCRHIFNDYTEYNLEDAGLRDSISLDPKGFIRDCGEKVIIDEVQHMPELFSYIQIEADEHPERRFILTGSSNFSLMEKISQSLAGRAALFTLLPMSFREIGRLADIATDELMLRGFYPSVITGARPADMFYANYYSTYVERDVRMIKNITDISQFQKFVRLLAGRTGCEMNASQLANETGISSPTIKSWMSVLETSYIAFLLPPNFTNLNTRLTKTPKVYFYDTGLLCYLLGIEEPWQLQVHPLRGAIFENMAVSQLIKQRFNAGKRSNLFFYRENSGRETDIVREEPEGLYLFEVKSSSTFNKAFTDNLTYLKKLLADKVVGMKVVYDGEAIPPMTVNIRDI